MRVLIFGASITQGFWDTEGGWVGRLRQYYDEKYIADMTLDQPTIFNLGISANKASDVLERFEGETNSRQQRSKGRKHDLAIVIAVGTNDAVLENGVPWSSVDQYETNLKKLIQVARKYTARIMIVGLASCDESKTMPVSWDSAISYKNESISEIENIMKKVASESSLPFVPIFNAFKEKDIQVGLLADGLHPNNKGHEFIFNLVKPEFEKFLGA